MKVSNAFGEGGGCLGWKGEGLRRRRLHPCLLSVRLKGVGLCRGFCRGDDQMRAWSLYVYGLV